MTPVVHLLSATVPRPRLLPHGLDGGWDFEQCGTTTSRRPCQAWSVSGDRQCPKNAAVVLHARFEVQATLSPFALALCGGHFDVHRAGKSLEVVL